jgi:nitrate reductase assembly molybdenum cofactor insertion protein NarJ
MKISVLSLTFALAGVLVYAQKTAPPQPSSVSARGAASQNARTASPQNARAQRSYDVSDLLNAASEARAAVESQNQQDALFHVDHAIQKAQDAETAAPDTRFIPIYTELDRYSVVGPILNQRTSAQNTQGETANRGAAVLDVQGQYTTAGLDVQAAKDHLTAARQAINQREWQKAAAALDAVQDGVVVTTVTADLPLLRARENMIVAREAAETGNYGEVRAALTSASNALREYENAQGRHANEARMLQSQIDSYGRTVQQNHSDAVSKIDSWWNQVADWTTTVEPKG